MLQYKEGPAWRRHQLRPRRPWQPVAGFFADIVVGAAHLLALPFEELCRCLRCLCTGRRPCPRLFRRLVKLTSKRV